MPARLRAAGIAAKRPCMSSAVGTAAACAEQCHLAAAVAATLCGPMQPLWSQCSPLTGPTSAAPPWLALSCSAALKGTHLLRLAPLIKTSNVLHLKSLLSCTSRAHVFKEVHANTFACTHICVAWQGCCSEAAALIFLLAAAQLPRCPCRTAAQQGGGDFVAPVQRVTDFLAEQPSTGSLPTSSYRSAARQACYFVVQHRS